MFRLGARVRLDLPEPWAAAVVEVDTVVSGVIAVRAVTLASAFLSADTDKEGPPMVALYDFVADEARPSWDFVDGRGPIPPSAAGMLRLPTDLAVAIVDAWVSTLPQPAPRDASVPGGDVPVPGLSDEDIAAFLAEADRGRQ